MYLDSVVQTEFVEEEDEEFNEDEEDAGESFEAEINATLLVLPSSILKHKVN